MTKVPIVFTFTDDFIVPAYIAMKSLIEYAGAATQYEIIIFHYDLSRHHIDILNRLTSSTVHTMRFKYISEHMFDRFPRSAHWPVIVYVRLFLPELLEKYDKIIYSDVDVLFQGDLLKVYNINMKGYDWGGVKAEINNKHMVGHKYFKNNFNKYIYMSGFMVCNLNQMRKTGFTDTVRKNICEYAQELQMFDLDILNMSSNHIKEVPIRYAVPVALYLHRNMRCTTVYSYMKNVYTYSELKEERRKKKIIHYAGVGGKPWLRLCPDYLYYQYLRTLPRDLKIIYRRNKAKALKQKAIQQYVSILSRLSSRV